MAPTYTSPTLSVSHGEITSHDTDSVASDITILNAECRWRGVTTQDSETTRLPVTEYNNSGEFQLDGDVFKTVTIPDLSADEFNEHEFRIHTSDRNPNNLDLSIDIEIRLGDANGSLQAEYRNITDFRRTFAGTAGDRIYEVADTQTNYSGEELGEDYVAVFYIDYVGTSFTAKLSVTSEGEDVNTSTTTYKTKDPFVTRDVDGSYAGTLNDGTWSAWQSLTGLAEGVNEFYHNISGSNQADFEFRYDWEYAYPEAVGGVLSIGARDGGAIYRVALADPSSPRLDYNHVRALVGGSVYAIDVVDPGDPDAIAWARIGTSQGVVCPRAFATESV